MTFTYFVGISIVANGIGAFASLLAGLADRWGRANLVTYGLLITGLLYAFALPHAPSKLWFAASTRWSASSKASCSSRLPP